MSNNRRIQRVPALLIAEEEDEKKKNDYYPKVASIGPYHYGKPELAQVEAFKPVAVDLLVRGKKDFVYQKVLAMIDQVRNCYEEESVDKYSDADLAQMMLRDASLIIAEMEIYLEHGETYHKRKAMIDHFGRLTGAVLFRDFILVENQIPLCVIQLLIELRHGAGTAPEMINNYANKCIFGEIRPIVKSSRVPLHLLEFMHIILVYDGEAKESSRGSYSTGDSDMAVMAPNHTLLLGSPQHATKTSNREDEESSIGELGGASAAPNWLIDESTSSELGAPGDPNHTLMLGSLKHATEVSVWSIKKSCSGELGAPGGPNLTLTLAPHKPPSETSSNGSTLYDDEIVAPDHTLTREGIVITPVDLTRVRFPVATCAADHTLKLESPPTVISIKASPQHATEVSNWSIEESCSGELGAPGGPNHTLMREDIVIRPLDRTREFAVDTCAADHRLALESPPTVISIKASPQHATETSNKAKKVSNKAKEGTHSFRKVMELKARGIHFRHSATQSLLDVKFESGFFYAKLQLPEVFLSHYSKPFFKNLVAYELLPGVETEPKVTSYIKLMQLLVERPEDLEELRERKIVYNQLGSDEEALNVFKDINTHGASNDRLYLKVREEIQEHYNNRIKTWIAELIHTHFRSPWTFAAFLAAAAVIALTAAQLYYAVHPVADKTPTSS